MKAAYEISAIDSSSAALRRQQRSGSQPTAGKAVKGFPCSSEPVARRIAASRSGSMAIT
ncbi:hypothetical protein [Fodinicola feengrottensis]|uniref:hypothetical protein n=1 Tax=Fodinicola feengrottensis TaxID=435914 RepID=UPI002442D83B|nr:hypothetical protein [Fodinicola feengrottensis]